MGKEEAKKQIEELIKNLNQWNYEYYALDNPTVSDAIYDKAMNALIALESEFPEFKRIDSPTLRVGGYVADKFVKVKHLKPMMSLSNAFNDADLLKFNDDLEKIIQEPFNYVVEPKIDGLSISLIYENAKLARALTRGDGIYGEDVTSNILTIKEIPLFINDKYKNEVVEIRGEIYMNSVDFLKLNQNLEAGVKPFANPRNAAAGTLRNLDSSIAASRNLKAYFYYLSSWKEMGFQTHFAVIEWLRHNKFPVSNEIKKVNTIKEAIKAIKAVTKMREELSYQIDGVVLKLNQYNFYEKIGYTSKFPKWAIAYKFPAVIGLTKLLKINCDVGRTGKITYVGELEPIFLDGSMISKVSLNNADYIKLKDIKINDYVYIFKAGDIIPYLDYVATNKRTKAVIDFKETTHCPSCDSELVRLNNDVDQRCINENCKIQNIRKIDYFCSRECMNIQGISFAIIEKLYENNFLKNIVDLYKIENFKAQILHLDLKIKEKAFQNMINSINGSKNNSLEKFLNGLSIRHLGKTMSKKIAQKFLNIDMLIIADEATLININDVGEILAKEIYAFFRNEKNLSIIKELQELGINMTYLTNEVELSKTIYENYLNKTMVITGTFSLPRDQIKTILENTYNIKFVNTISKNVDYLLSGNEPGTKLQKANDLNIPIIKEEFWKN